MHPVVLPPTLFHSAASPPHSPLVLELDIGEPQALSSRSQSVSPLSKLREITAHLPETVPLAVSSDCIMALTGDPKSIVAIQKLEEPDEDLYEWLDKILNS